MKKKITLILFFFIFIFTISSCKTSKKKSNNQIIDNPTSMYIKYDTDDYSVPEPTNHSDLKVIYDCNNGFKYSSFLNSNSKVEKPTTDPKKKASTFVGWYCDEKLTTEFDFNSTHSKDVTIYAKYETDFEELTNLVYDSAILSNIKVLSMTSSNPDYDGATTTVGSGVIISASETGYYALTNYHVIYKESTHIYQKILIYDCYNNEYKVDIDVNQKAVYYDVDYDLALLQFTRINTEGRTVKEKLDDIYFSNFIPKENETIISVGTPHRIMNSISYGKYLGLKSYKAEASIRYKSNVNFDVLTHSAKIVTGSSGGMVLDSNLRLIGINFASKMSGDEFEFAYSIPLNKIIEFIINYENKD